MEQMTLFGGAGIRLKRENFDFDGREIENAPILNGKKVPCWRYASACGACLCNRCSNNADRRLQSGDRKADFPCLICEECNEYTGELCKYTQARNECEFYKPAEAEIIEINDAKEARRKARIERTKRLLGVT